MEDGEESLETQVVELSERIDRLGRELAAFSRTTDHRFVVVNHQLDDLTRAFLDMNRKMAELREHHGYR